MSQVAERPDRLDEVMSRLDRIEARLDRLVGVLDQALPAVAMAADAADELARDAAGRPAGQRADTGSHRVLPQAHLPPAGSTRCSTPLGWYRGAIARNCRTCFPSQ